MTEPVWFTVTADYKSVLQDASSDADYDGELGPVSATVTFTPILNNGDIILATEASPRPTGFVPTPVVARIDVTDGRLKLRVDPDDGGTGTFAPVRLLANSPLLELDSDLAYRAVFSNVVFGSKSGYLKPVTFLAPETDTEVNLITVTPIPGSPGVGITRGETGASGAQGASGGTGGTGGVGATGLTGSTGPTGPTGASGIAATINVGTVQTGTPGSNVTVTNSGTTTAAVFDISIPRGDVGASGGTGGVGASGAQGASGIPGEIGPAGPTGASGASGGTGGTGGTGAVGASGLAGQAANLLGTVASYSALTAISSPADGDAYLINDGAGKIYIYDTINGWPANGDGIQFVGPVGASGLQGASGIPGQDGASGIPGAVGSTGPAGPQGDTGPAGASGAQGASGGTGGTGGVGATGVAGTTTWSGITDKPAVIAAGVDAAAARTVISAEFTGNKGAANGYASLDSSGLVPSSQLPGFVDDVIEGANLAAFPATGAAGVMYVALDTNKVFRWGGSTYVEISGSPGSTDAVPEGSTNLYYTAARADGRITAAVGSSVQAYSPTLTTYAGKTAPTGAVVGDTDTQTLTNKSISGSANTLSNIGIGSIGASGTPSASTFLRGDGSWAAGPIGATGASGASGAQGASGGTGAAGSTGPGFFRDIATLTTPTTLGASGSTDYVRLLGTSSTDSSFASVTALLTGDGANNSTTITDSSNLAADWTVSGNAKISTAVKKYGTGSISFDANAATRITPSAAVSNFAFGTADFTIEFWLYFNNLSGTQVAADWRPSASASYPTIYMSSNTLKFFESSDRITSGSLSATTWYHVAVSRSGTSTRMFIDGTQVGSTYTDSTNYLASSGSVRFGNSHDSFGLNGYLDDIRVTKGVARYTANFTAPTAALPGPIYGTPTLPAAATASTNKSFYYFRNIAALPIIIGASGSQVINGATGGLSLAANATAHLVSDGTGWYSL